MSSDIPISKPPIFTIVDDDIVHVVTGYNKENSRLFTKDASISNLKKYILDTNNIIAGNCVSTEKIADSGVRIHTTGLNTRTENLIVRDLESVWPYSGIIYNTGLNAAIGNNIDIQFSTTGTASAVYAGAGGKYRSGIISTTGINARTENLIVKEFENAWPYSGIIYNTGLNAIVGNNIEIQFSTGTPASNIYGGTAGKYKSGIISTTGINARTENLIVRDFDTSWPHTGVIYNTGLNARAGNLIQIQYSSNSPAGGLYGGTEGKYFSGIISTTGLNMIDGNNIGYTIGDSYPHKYTIFTADRARQSLLPYTISNNSDLTTSYSISGYIDNDLLLDYSNFFTSKPNEYIGLISNFKILLDENNIIFSIPTVPGLGSSNTAKELELLTAMTTPYEDHNVASCTMQMYTDEMQNNYWVCEYNTKTLTDPTGWNPENWEPVSLSIISNSFNFNISISGGSSSALFATYPVEFTNIATGLNNAYGGNFTFGSDILYEKHRNFYSTNANNTQYLYVLNNELYKGYSIDPISIEYMQQLYINSNIINSQNSTAPRYDISNIQYSRTYRKLIGYSDGCLGNSCTPNVSPVYRYYTANSFRGRSSLTVNKRYLKTKNTEV